jgi:parvulin-like peptidyl-prolyl isomerase
MAPSSVRLRLLVAIPVAVFALSACGDTFHAPAAVVNGADITDDELRAGIPLYQFLASIEQVACGQPVAGESLQKACVRLVLSRLVEQEIAIAYAGRHDITVADRTIDRTIRSLELRLGGHGELVNQLHRQGTTYSQFRRLVGRLILVRDVVRAVAAETIPEQELRQRYEQERIQFTNLRVAHILVDRREDAARIAREATPENFATLARTNSKDPGSASAGGDLGTVPATQLDPDFVNAALALHPGEISGPVHTQFGWHVIFLKGVDIIPFQLAKTRLIEQEAGDAFGAWFRERLRDGSVEVNPRYGRLDTATGQVLPVRSTASTPAP